MHLLLAYPWTWWILTNLDLEEKLGDEYLINDTQKEGWDA